MRSANLQRGVSEIELPMGDAERRRLDISGRAYQVADTWIAPRDIASQLNVFKTDSKATARSISITELKNAPTACLSSWLIA